MKVRPIHKWFLLLGFPALLLSGCAMPAPKVSANPAPGSPSMDAELLRSVESIQAVTNNLRAAHSVAWHAQYQGFPLGGPSQSGGTLPQPIAGAPKSGPLAQRFFVQWSGPVDVIGKALASRLGWTYRDKSGLGSQMDVSVYGKHVTVLEILQTVAKQLPSNLVLRVEPGKLVLRQVGGGR